MLLWNQWPSLYWAQVHAKDPRSQEEGLEWLALRLPHECIGLLRKLGDLEAMLEAAILETLSYEHRIHCQRQAGSKLLPLGLWGMVSPATGTAQSLWAHSA